MEVKSCRGCGKLYNSLGPSTPVCPSCMKKMEDKFIIVKEYIYDHRGADIQTVSQENDVSVKQIKQWVREERLSFTEGSAVGIECENCGANILTGRFCNECKAKLATNLNNAIKKPIVTAAVKKDKKDGSAKMRFLE